MHRSHNRESFNGRFTLCNCNAQCTMYNVLRLNSKTFHRIPAHTLAFKFFFLEKPHLALRVGYSGRFFSFSKMCLPPQNCPILLVYTGKEKLSQKNCSCRKGVKLLRAHARDYLCESLINSKRIKLMKLKC